MEKLEYQKLEPPHDIQWGAFHNSLENKQRVIKLIQDGAIPWVMTREQENEFMDSGMDYIVWADMSHGIPVVIQCLMEWVDESSLVEFLKAIPVGADLFSIWPKFGLWMIDDPDYGLANDGEPNRVEKTRNAYTLWANHRVFPMVLLATNRTPAYAADMALAYMMPHDHSAPFLYVSSIDSYLDRKVIVERKQADINAAMKAKLIRLFRELGGEDNERA